MNRDSKGRFCGGKVGKYEKKYGTSGISSYKEKDCIKRDKCHLRLCGELLLDNEEQFSTINMEAEHHNRDFGTVLISVFATVDNDSFSFSTCSKYEVSNCGRKEDVIVRREGNKICVYSKCMTPLEELTEESNKIEIEEG